MLGKILVVLLGCPLGIVIIWKRTQIVELVGVVGFAEQYLGAGGTYTFFLLVGVLVFVGSLMYGTGTLQSMLAGAVGMFF